MSSNEWTTVKRLALLVIVAALFPIGALAYRVVFDVSAGTAAEAPLLYTLVPEANAPISVATPSPTAVVVVVPNGWKQYTIQDQNITIALPARWQRLPVNPQELDASLQMIRQSNPELAAALGARGQELLSTGVKFWAFDFDPESSSTRFATNLTITRQLLPNPVSFDTYVQVNLSQLEQLATRQGELKHDRVLLGNLLAERVKYNLAFQASDGSVQVSAISQFLALKGSNAYVLTFATRQDQFDKYASTFDKCAASFKLLAP